MVMSNNAIDMTYTTTNHVIDSESHVIDATNQVLNASSHVIDASEIHFQTEDGHLVDSRQQPLYVIQQVTSQNRNFSHFKSDYFEMPDEDSQFNHPNCIQHNVLKSST